MRYDDDLNFMPRDMSYFEEMRWRAENEVDSESRGHAQYEVDRMVNEMNKAEEMSRLKGAIDDEMGSIFDGIYFEANDRITREKVDLWITKFLDGVRRRGHIEEFEVICDETNNTPTTIDRNELHVTLILNRGHGLKVDVLKYTAASAPIMAVDVDIDITNGSGHGGYPTGASTSITPANSSGSNASAGSSINISGGNQYGYGYSLSATSVGAISVSGLNGISAADFGSVTLSLQPTDNPDLPSTVFTTYNDAGDRVTLTLAPESDISARESLLIARMIHATTTNPSSFSVFHFVRKQNLERHFKFAA